MTKYIVELGFSDRKENYEYGKEGESSGCGLAREGSV